MKCVEFQRKIDKLIEKMLTHFSRIPSDPSQLSVSCLTSASTLIGKGGFGTVYLYRHPIDGNEYAIKRLSIRNSEDQISAFREVQLLSCLFHSNIIRYHHSWIELHSHQEDLFSEESSNEESASHDSHSLAPSSYVLCYQMEYCPSNLAFYLEHRDKCYRKRELWMEQEILGGLMYLHEQDIIHGDLTPRNILLTHHGSIKLADFGLSTWKGESVSSSQVGGHTLYRAPEIGEIFMMHPSSDLYSVGLLFLEIHSFFQTEMEKRYTFRVWRHLNESDQKYNYFLGTFLSYLIRSNPDERWTACQSYQYLRHFYDLYQECETILEECILSRNAFKK